MRRANGTGSVKKLSGKRRNPYIAVVNFRNPDGSRTQRQVVPACRTKREAQAALEAWLAENTIRDSLLAFATLRTCIDSALDEILPNLSGASNENYSRARDHIYAGGIADERIRDLRLADLQGVLNTYEGASKTYLNNMMIVMRYGYRWAMKNDIIAKDYAVMLEMPKYKDKKEKHILTETEINALWDRYYSGDEYADYALILLYTGVRISEFIGITADDVHPKEGYIEVHGTKNKASDRIVPIHPDIAGIVRDTIAIDGNYISKVNLRKYIGKYGHTPHEYRHTFTTYANACGLEKVWLQKILGHTNPGSAMTDDLYTHTLVPALRREISKLKFDTQYIMKLAI